MQCLFKLEQDDQIQVSLNVKYKQNFMTCSLARERTKTNENGHISIGIINHNPMHNKNLDQIGATPKLKNLQKREEKMEMNDHS